MSRWPARLVQWGLEAFIGLALACLLLWVLAMSSREVTFVYQGY